MWLPTNLPIKTNINHPKILKPEVLGAVKTARTENTVVDMVGSTAGTRGTVDPDTASGTSLTTMAIMDTMITEAATVPTEKVTTPIMVKVLTVEDTDPMVAVKFLMEEVMIPTMEDTAVVMTKVIR